jgi:spore maturation protein CgeB
MKANAAQITPGQPAGHRVLAANLEVLARRQPELARRLWDAAPPAGAEIVASRKGPPCLKVNGHLICSAVDPRGEGISLAHRAPEGPLLVLGFGLGYHLEPLLERDLVVWQPDAALLRLALSARDLRPVLERARLAVDRAELGDVAGRAAWALPAAARLYPGQAQALARLVSQPPAAKAERPARPRVLVVGPVYGGSLEMAGWCAQALEELGCQVKLPPLEAVEPIYRLLRESRLPAERTAPAVNGLLGFLSRTVETLAEEFEPHLVLALAQAPLEPRAVEALSKNGASTAFWFVEDFRVRPYFRQVASAYDHFFHIQGRAMTRELTALGARHHHLPLAAHPALHRPLSLGPEERGRWGAEVGFLGQGYPNRVRVFSRLARRFTDLRLWGTGWPGEGALAGRVAEDGRRISSPDVVKVYNACDLVVNLHTAPPEGNGPVDYLNPRTFEVAACGGFQLVDRTQGVERLFTPDRELAVFQGEKQLAEMIGHYLARPQERFNMAQAARRRVLAEHTYFHRMETVLATCLGAASPGKDTRRDAVDILFHRLAAASI